MQLNSQQRPRRTLALTPLIDVVFLLLVFFMLASTFLKFDAVRIETAGFGVQEKVDTSSIVLVHVHPGGTFRVNGEETKEAQIPTILASMIAQGKKDAVIVPHKECSVSDLVHGLSIIKRSNVRSLRVVN